MLKSVETEAPREDASRLAALHSAVENLRRDVESGGENIAAAWQASIHRPEFEASARNLANYLAFRTVDVRDCQPQLAALGLSSLGRCESHVLASIEAVLASLSSLIGGARRPHPPAADFEIAGETLLRRKCEIFGADPTGPSTRIMVTLPSEAADDADMVSNLIAAGADCARINCAHDSKASWAKMIEHVRAGAAAQNRDVRIAMDLAGPKFRIVDVRGDKKMRLFRGDHCALVSSFSDNPGMPEATVSHHMLLAGLDIGSIVSINDGKIGAKVVERTGERAILEITNAREKGERLKPEKGVNVPGAELDVPALTEDDLKNLDFVAQEADIVGFSFVQTPADVRDLLAALKARRGDRPLPAIMLKIETPLAVRNLPRLIVQAGAETQVAVMIARGDLAVEIGLERLAEIQEEILWLCEAASVPVVWATQVLEGMIKDGMASRAETTDAAMGQRAECVMLNKGPHLVKAVRFLDAILRRMDRHQMKKSALLGPLQSWAGSQAL